MLLACGVEEDLRVLVGSRVARLLCERLGVFIDQAGFPGRVKPQVGLLLGTSVLYCNNYRISPVVVPLK